MHMLLQMINNSNESQWKMAEESLAMFGTVDVMGILKRECAVQPC